MQCTMADHVADKMLYKANAQISVKMESTWIKVEVETILTNKQTEQAEVEARIKSALRRFIDVEWALSLMRRWNHKSGFEQVTVSAMANVPFREVFNLSERAQLASEDGLTINEPELRSAISRETSERATFALRETILKQVAGDAKRYSEITGRQWRIGEINFGVSSDLEVNERVNSKGAYARNNSSSVVLDTVIDGAMTAVTVMTLHADVALHGYDTSAPATAS